MGRWWEGRKSVGRPKEPASGAGIRYTENLENGIGRTTRFNYRVNEVTDQGLWWAVQDSNLRPPACKAGALTS